jgi:hypothetical protein
MPLPTPSFDTTLLRYSLIVAGMVVPSAPGLTGAAKLTREPGEGTEAGAFYYRDKLTGPLEFSGDDFILLYGIETSTDRCQAIGLLVESRAQVGAAWVQEYLGTFTCAECAFNLDQCTVSVTPVTNDRYRALLEAWDAEVNLLSTPGGRTTVKAQLAVLRAGIDIEFLRTDATAEADFVGVDGWATFLRNTSWISGEDFEGGVREQTVLLFRYRLRGVDMVPDPANPGGYLPVNKSAAGWVPLPETRDNTPSPPTIDYVKAPEISNFRPYKITHFNDWTDPTNSSSRHTHGDSLLLLPCGAVPSDHGYSNAAYIRVTGLDGVEPIVPSAALA